MVLLPTAAQAACLTTLAFPFGHSFLQGVHLLPYQYTLVKKKKEVMRKGRGTWDQITSIRWITEKAREFRENISFCFTDYVKAFDGADHKKLWEILQEMGIPDHITCLLRNLYAGQETTVRTRHGKTTGSKLGKEYNKALYCHLLNLSYMQSTSCYMLGWINHKPESRRHEKYQQSHHLCSRKWRGIKEPLEEGERGEWKSWLERQHSKK